jgi:hypothetical protein
MGWDLENSYSGLPKEFFSAFSPVTWPNIGLYNYNEALGTAIGLPRNLHTDKEWAEFLSGVHFPEEAYPISQAYAGHQFGHFTLLGDGRAVLLGEQIAPDGKKMGRTTKRLGNYPLFQARRREGNAECHVARISDERSHARLRHPHFPEFGNSHYWRTSCARAHARWSYFDPCSIQPYSGRYL